MLQPNLDDAFHRVFPGGIAKHNHPIREAERVQVYLGGVIQHGLQFGNDSFAAHHNIQRGKVRADVAKDKVIEAVLYMQKILLFRAEKLGELPDKVVRKK